MANEQKLSKWHPIFFRLTAFTVNPAQDENKWWTDVVGKLPDKKEEKPKTKERIIQDNFGSGKLTLYVNPRIVEWRYILDSEPKPPEAYKDKVEEFITELKIFQNVIQKWFTLDSISQTARLAFGTVIFQPLSNYDDSPKLLKDFQIPFKELENTSDFLYQINRPRPVTFENMNLMINRLAKWSVDYFSGIRFTIPSAETETLPSIYRFQLDLDINTAPQKDIQFTPEQMQGLFDKLVNMAKEITQEGDIQ